VKRLLSHLTRAGAFGLAIYAGVIDGHVGVGRLLAGAAMVETAVYLLTVVALIRMPDKNWLELVAKHRPHSPLLVRTAVGLDLAMVAVLVWHGWFLTGIAILVGCALKQFALALVSRAAALKR
jgi:hypothetical protein